VTQLGFALDQRSCIGCHACTVACKVEHGVELGVFRTWVKYIEEGAFPDVSRNFAVMRCNQCTDAPCVTICPVKSLYKREDGIVDFDPERCIGCKACMNACPYDALYVEPHSGTAAKCNFCAHRVDQGLKPACEVVCPTNAIISGDLDDPASELSRLLADTPSAVRAPEQGTGPNVFYLGSTEATLDPLLVSGDAYLYSEVPPSQAEKLAPLADEATARAMHDVAHPPPWGWRVSTYFLTKGIAAGAMMLAFAGALAGAIALAGIAVTGAILTADLKRPDRVHRLLFRPQWRSWLALGAQCINFAALVAAAYTVCALLDADGVRELLRWAMVPAGVLLAGYTAFLFRQCEGRDLWQSPLLLPHTIVNALLAGAAAFALWGVDEATYWLVGSAALSAVLALVDAVGTHPTGQGRQAAANLRRMRGFRLGTAAIAIAAPLAILLAPVAAAIAIAGLWSYEHAWVRAGQSVPLS
jgi:Fe-S-cluster-containing dehydrogenase component